MMAEKELHFISKLSSYTLKNTLIRVLSVSLVCTLFLFLVSNVLGEVFWEIPVMLFIKVTLTFVIISEANVLIDNLSERWLPIPDRIGLRILTHLVVSAILTASAYFYFEYLLNYDNLFHEAAARLFIALGIIFLLILIIFSIGIRITEKWINSRDELEVLKQEKLMSDYNSLQDQLNPHFMFNNLSVLKSMIIYDQNAAVEFTQNFTDVYRYVLKSHEHTTVKLMDEMAFIKSYIGIHKERLGQNLVVNIDVDEITMDRNIPPLSLQLLVENAIKHNVASRENPLTIDIFTEGENILVQNNLQPKESSFSTRNGLKNLVKRYDILSSQKVHVIQDQNKFKVTLPLL